jgi:hypothetical protein
MIDRNEEVVANLINKKIQKSCALIRLISARMCVKVVEVVQEHRDQDMVQKAKDRNINSKSSEKHATDREICNLLHTIIAAFAFNFN